MQMAAQAYKDCQVQRRVYQSSVSRSSLLRDGELQEQAEEPSLQLTPCHTILQLLGLVALVPPQVLSKRDPVVRMWIMWVHPNVKDLLKVCRRAERVILVVEVCD